MSEEDNIHLHNSFLNVQINPLGGELRSIQDASGLEYLWQSDPAYWSGRAPNLFPYIGRLTEQRYTVNGQEYHMLIHGFLRDQKMKVIASSAQALQLQFAANDETKKVYPFDFIFTMSYTLDKNVISIQYAIENSGDKTMYFGVGGHPGFNVPIKNDLTFSDYYLEFPEASDPKQVIFSENCFVTNTRVSFSLKEGKILPLQHQLFDHDAIVLTGSGGSVTLKSDKASQSVTVHCPQMPYLGFWHTTRSDAPFLCIEPWSSLPARDGIIEDFATQPGLIRLPANEQYLNTWQIGISA